MGAVKDINIWMVYGCCVDITWDTSLPRHYNHDQTQIDQWIFTSSPYFSGSSGLMDLTGTYSLSICQVLFTCFMLLSPFQGHLHPQDVLNSPSEKTMSRSPVLPSSYGKTLDVRVTEALNINKHINTQLSGWWLRHPSEKG